MSEAPVRKIAAAPFLSLRNGAAAIAFDEAAFWARHLRMPTRFWINLQIYGALAVPHKHARSVIEREVLPRDVSVA